VRDVLAICEKVRSFSGFCQFVFMEASQRVDGCILLGMIKLLLLIQYHKFR
jgi:hypothetical protein